MTSDEIDAEIVDTAARLFARHGYRQTSVQVIADEVGYSKTGLLHRFPSKETLHEAVVADFRSQLSSVVDDVDAHPVGRSRDRAVLEAVLDVGARRPGLVRLMFNLLTLQDDDPDAALLEEAPRTLLAAFGVTGDLDDAIGVEPARVVPILAALGVLAVSILVIETHPAARPAVVEAAMGALGHH